MSFVDIEDLRRELLKVLGKDEDDLDDDELDVYLNRSYWDLLNKYPFREKEAWMDMTFNSGIRLYNVVSPFEALRNIFVIDPNSKKRTPLERKSIRVYEEEHSEDDTGMPEIYLREGGKIKISPIPDQTYDGIMHYWTTLEDLSDDNNIMPLPREWREIVLFGAEWRGWHDVGNDARRAIAQKLQMNMLNALVPVESKEEDDSFKAGVSIYGRSGK